jgi:hypothetical protein
MIIILYLSDLLNLGAGICSEERYTLTDCRWQIRNPRVLVTEALELAHAIFKP